MKYLILPIILLFVLYIIILSSNKNESEKLCKNNWYEYFQKTLFSKIDKDKDNYKIVYDWNDWNDYNCIVFSLEWKIIDKVNISYIRKFYNSIEQIQKRQEKEENIKKEKLFYKEK